MGSYDEIINKDGATLMCPQNHIIPLLQTERKAFVREFAREADKADRLWELRNR